MDIEDLRGMGELGKVYEDGLNEIVNKCPVCHHIIAAIGVLDYELDNALERRLIYYCPNQDCQELFIVYYRRESRNYTYEKYKVEPINIESMLFDKIVVEFSTDFIEIYNQSYKAEQLGLMQICGIGYRKALEFLIKDYLIKQVKAQNIDEIKKMFIGKCIDQYIQDDNIKQIAKRAIWLGNDETHYERRWLDKDINDLKELINITIYWITMTEKTKAVLQSMPNAK